MISKSLQEMVKGRWREFTREPSALFFVVFMPILWMLILGLAFSDHKEEHFRLGVLPELTHESSPWGAKIKKALRSQPYLSVISEPEEQLLRRLKRGDILLYITPARSQGGISYHFDPHNPQAQRLKDLTDATIQTAFGRQDPLATEVAALDRPGSRYIDFLIPGLLALSLFTSSLFGTGMTIVANRRESLLKRYRATPMSSYAYIVSHIIGRYAIFTVEFLAILISGKLLFNFSMQGDWLTFLLMAMLSTASFTALSIFCGARTGNTSTYNGMVNLITLPMMLLSGVWFSRSHFPDWLSSLIDLLPLTASVDALRKIALEGASFSSLGFEAGVLAVYGLIFTVLAKKIFRWY